MLKPIRHDAERWRNEISYRLTNRNASLPMIYRNFGLYSSAFAEFYDKFHNCDAYHLPEPEKLLSRAVARKHINVEKRQKWAGVAISDNNARYNAYSSFAIPDKNYNNFQYVFASIDIEFYALEDEYVQSRS